MDDVRRYHNYRGKHASFRTVKLLIFNRFYILFYALRFTFFQDTCKKFSKFLMIILFAQKDASSLWKFIHLQILISNLFHVVIYSVIRGGIEILFRICKDAFDDLFSIFLADY